VRSKWASYCAYFGGSRRFQKRIKRYTEIDRDRRIWATDCEENGWPVRLEGFLDCCYGLATSCRLLKNIGLFCRMSSLLLGSFAKETFDFKEPTNRSHPIS